ncbi:MAG: biliverdin-producing heme oxygenase [Gammaproteobacteria bacterium]|nr:biliverdin-producing heme oxygenase [Gammaproteobacteria bacterium]
MTDNLTACKVAKPDIATRLRRETRDAHCRIEAVMSDLLFATPLDLQAYQDMLKLHRSYYELVEARLGQFRSTAVMMQERSKLSWLDSDIAYLEKDTVQSVADSDYCNSTALVLPENEAQAWGFLYVFEGATLGGGHILDRLRHQPHFKGRSGMRFFHSYGPKTPAMWREFQLSLQHFVAANPGSEKQIINGANLSFSNMYALMKGVQVD